MKYLSRLGVGHWIPLAALLLSIIVLATDARAQSRERGRTTESSRRSQVERKETKQRPTKKAPTKKVERGKSERRTPSTTPSSRRVESRQRSTRSAPSASSSRTREVERNQGRSKSSQANTRSSSRGRTSTERATNNRSNSSRSNTGRATTDHSESGRASTSRSRTNNERGSARSDSGRGTVAERERGSSGRSSTRGTTREETAQSRRVRFQVDNEGATTSRSREGTRRSREHARPSDASRSPRGSSIRVAKPSATRVEVGSRRVNFSAQWRNKYEHNRHYRKRHRKRRHNHHNRYQYYYKPTIVVRPFINVNIVWPWVHRHHHGWAPRYQYRQVVYVEAGWGRRHRRQAEIDVRTHYYHELRSANNHKAEVDIYIERVELYQDGRYLGEVDQIPERLSRIRATVYKDGRVSFNRDVFILGDSYTGFEMISTRYYDGHVLDSYRSSHGFRAGVLDLRQGRVNLVNYSRLFDPYDFNGYVPISLIPENESWLLDYGLGSFSANYYDWDPYYYGGYSGYGSQYDNPYYSNDYYEEDYYEDDYGRPHYSVRSTVGHDNFDVAPLTYANNVNYRTRRGAEINLKRETEFIRMR